MFTEIDQTNKQNPTNANIWAIGGGKGGVGKSFVISSIASSLALQGKKVILIDTDFGGANLHSMLGIQKPKNCLSDFFSKRQPLPELISPTSINGLGLIAGVINSFTPDSMNYAQKQKLFRHIQALDADFVLLDLGAGASFNIIDSFLLADKKIIVTLPEITAVENLYAFLQHAFFRRLERSLAQKRLSYIMKNALKRKQEYKIKNMEQLIKLLRSVSDEVREIVDQAVSAYELNLIVNKTKNNQDIIIGNSVKSVCLKYLGFKAKYVGYVEQDDSVSAAINKRKPYLQAYPTSRCAEEIKEATYNLLNDRQLRIRT